MFHTHRQFNPFVQQELLLLKQNKDDKPKQKKKIVNDMQHYEVAFNIDRFIA